MSEAPIEQHLARIKELMESADTPEIQERVRSSVSRLFNRGLPIESIANNLGFRIEILRKGVKRMFVYKELEKKFPQLKLNVKSEESNETEEAQFQRIPEAFLPPDDQEVMNGSGAGEMKKPKVFPRTQLTIEVLEAMGIKLTQCTFLEGMNLDNMLRNLSYRAIIVPKLGVTILVCDEEGNRTFVAYNSNHPEQFYRLRKSDLKRLEEDGVVSSLIWGDSEEWQFRLAELISFKPSTTATVAKEEEGQESRSTEIFEEGWLTMNGIREEHGINEYTSKKVSSRFQDTHPEWFKIFEGKRGMYLSPQLIDIIVKEWSEYEKAPSGWMTVGTLSESIGESHQAIANALEPFRKTHSDQFREYKLSGGRKLEHISPHLIDQVIRIFEQNKPAPKGWLTRNGINKKTDYTWHRMKKIIDTYRLTHPHWIRIFRDQIGHPREHYSPEFIDMAISKLQGVGSAPPGWMIQKALTNRIGRSESFINRATATYRETHPHWFADYHRPGAGILQHYSPELVEILISNAGIEKDAPPGWRTINSLIGELPAGTDKMREIASRYKNDKPEWFSRFNFRGHSLDFISPELEEIIRKEILSIPFAPDGWKTTNQIVRETEGSETLIRAILNDYRKKHPHWFQSFRYRAKRSRPCEHIAPELIKTIHDKIATREKPPTGWLTMHGIKTITDANYNEIVRITRRLATQYPDESKRFIDAIGHERVHFSPKFIEMVKAELN